METTQGAPDVIIILSGGIKQQPSGKWASTGLTEEDNKYGAPGGILRVLAAAVLAKKYPNATIIVSGGKGYDVSADAPTDRPLLAEIMRDELLLCGVESDRIRMETESNSSYQQLQEIQRLLHKEGYKKIMIVSNRYHMGRLDAFLDVQFSELKKSLFLELVSAEETLISDDAGKWKQSIAEAYSSEYMLTRISKEEQGIEQIRSGTYQFR